MFAYLKPGYAGLDNILAALHSTGAMVVSPDPLDLTAMHAGCDLAICRGFSAVIWKSNYPRFVGAAIRSALAQRTRRIGSR